MRKQTLHPRTAVINQKQKNQSKKTRLDALHWLQLTFPGAFDNRSKIQPLNVGIINDILAYAEQAAAVGISKSKLREAVVLFTRRLDYLICLKAREMRVDLLGNPVVAVSEEDAERAALKIRKRIEKSIKNMRKPELFQAEHPKRINRIETARAHPTFAPAHAGLSGETGATRVTVMHKQRPYDSVAIARLKEKMGIAQKVELEKE